MLAFRITLVGAWVAITVLSIHAVATLGPTDGSVFFTDFSNGWRAQTNGDFVAFILLAMAWIAYRERTFPRVLLALPTVLGSVYLLPYVFVATYTSRGRFAALLLGNARGGLSVN
ncbi:hypothetical protein SAMN05216223_110234 [Actinacidiphila yanglinensis]|uniref:DUF2834 domain-containing protein n=2 Tax=Actinacidiphila yanglinensis TaxID=310779 RepID=A0A1H6CWS8_9ACTN|nr:hypothetical protein SAMN05216223_110234 [Actinacidiphila yanglinensis]